ncbi:acyl-CoA dehydrogenase family protein [Trujillonella humicola]|uniref:acyl-CoA dehydrogenase family protein n=1 Tax=Trujillonella humicola TaxID=3383699 RepID=UPI003906C2E8
MRFRYDPEHDELRDSVRKLLADVSSEEAVRRDVDGERGWSDEAWRRLAGDLELAGLAVPEEFGGSGYGLIEAGVVLREAGRALLTAPLLSTTVAVRALLAAGDPAAAADHLPGLATGARTGTLAWLGPDADRDAPPSVRAERASEGWTLTGSRAWVLDGHAADLVVVPASTPAGLSLFLVERAGGGVLTEQVETVDPTRRVARVELTGAPATLLGEEGHGGPALQRALDEATALLAAEQVGLAERCLEMATEYAKQREQFGRPIGSFQAVKHKLATVLLEVEAATSAMMYALFVADRSPGELAEVACIAGVTCSEAALLAASENIQVHGGIGATWEHPAHLYLKRATVDRQLLGDPERHLERLSAVIGLTPTPA